MGAWGSGIAHNDVVLDVVGTFKDALKEGKSVAAASKLVKQQFDEMMFKDDEDGPLCWMGLAEAQWTYAGKLEAGLLKRIKADLSSGRSLERWDDDGPKKLAQRKKVIEQFIKKISSKNPSPKPPPKLVLRQAIFAAGDCLAVKQPNDQYAAVLVLAAQEKQEYPCNLLITLNYLSKKKPTLDVFRQRNWLRVSHHGWSGELDIGWHVPVGFKAAKHLIEIVGQIAILPSDPKESNSYGGWGEVGIQAVYQHQWDAQLRAKRRKKI